jgi:hypothetical protein
MEHDNGGRFRRRTHSYAEDCQVYCKLNLLHVEFDPKRQELRLDLCRFFLRCFPLRPAYSLGGSDSSSRSEGHPAARPRRKAACVVIQAPYNPDCVI